MRGARFGVQYVSFARQRLLHPYTAQRSDQSRSQRSISSSAWRRHPRTRTGRAGDAPRPGRHWRRRPRMLAQRCRLAKLAAQPAQQAHGCLVTHRVAGYPSGGHFPGHRSRRETGSLRWTPRCPRRVVDAFSTRAVCPGAGGTLASRGRCLVLSDPSETCPTGFVYDSRQPARARRSRWRWSSRAKCRPPSTPAGLRRTCCSPRGTRSGGSPNGIADREAPRRAGPRRTKPSSSPSSRSATAGASAYRRHRAGEWSARAVRKPLGEVVREL